MDEWGLAYTFEALLYNDSCMSCYFFEQLLYSGAFDNDRQGCYLGLIMPVDEVAEH